MGRLGKSDKRNESVHRKEQHVMQLLRNEKVNGTLHTFVTDVVFTHGKSFQHMSVPVHTVRMESRYNNCLFDKRQFYSNLLLITPFLTV